MIGPLAGNRLGDGEQRLQRLARLNKSIIVVLAWMSMVWSYDQLLHPNLSVAYSRPKRGLRVFFSGLRTGVVRYFFKKHPARAGAASVTAVVVHFAVTTADLRPTRAARCLTRR
ncbi:MAG: hypothetical protein IPM98_11620 [Lewinellaceae bacterium]|nr:hypothetical protein [Lewinellaceae bacterium]